jgi:hypothetical protein
MPHAIKSPTYEGMGTADVSDGAIALVRDHLEICGDSGCP